MGKGGRNYQPKGLLHAPRFTTTPRDCNICGKPLPIPHPTSKRTHDECRSDPVRLEQQRLKENKRARDLEAEKRAAAGISQPKLESRTCKHREGHRNPETGHWEPLGSLEMDPICGEEFTAIPRIDKNGVNRGIHADQKYCPDHQKPEAVAHRRLLSLIGDLKRYKIYLKSQVAHRHRNLTTIREKQRVAAKAKRARVAALLPVEKIMESEKDKLLEGTIALFFKMHPEASDADAGKIFKTSIRTIQRAHHPAGIVKKVGRPKTL